MESETDMDEESTDIWDMLERDESIALERLPDPRSLEAFDGFEPWRNRTPSLDQHFWAGLGVDRNIQGGGDIHHVTVYALDRNAEWPNPALILCDVHLPQVQDQLDDEHLDTMEQPMPDGYCELCISRAYVLFNGHSRFQMHSLACEI